MAKQVGRLMDIQCKSARRSKVDLLVPAFNQLCTEDKIFYGRIEKANRLKLEIICGPEESSYNLIPP